MHLDGGPVCAAMTVHHRRWLKGPLGRGRTDMIGILSSWLTPGEVHDLVNLAVLGLLTLLGRYAGAYALLTRCIRHTRPEDRSEVLLAAAEVLRSLRGKRSARRPVDNESAEEVPLIGSAKTKKNDQRRRLPSPRPSGTASFDTSAVDNTTSTSPRPASYSDQLTRRRLIPAGVISCSAALVAKQDRRAPA